MQSIHFYPPTRHIDKQPSRQRCAHPYINRCLSPYRHSWAGALRRAAAKVCRRRHQPPHLVCAPGRRSVVFDRSRDRRTGEGAPRPGTPSREPASSGGARSLSPGGWLASRVGVWCVDGALRAESWDPGCAQRRTSPGRGSRAEHSGDLSPPMASAGSPLGSASWHSGSSSTVTSAAYTN